MRWFFALCLLGIGCLAQAADVLLIPENNPKPIYPRALFRAGVMGEVRISFVAHADGSVSKINILHSDHPDLAEPTKAAVAQWRFKPWAVEGDKPAEIVIVAPMEFRLDLDQPIHVNKQLKTLRCRTVNENLGNIADYAWIDTKVFVHTRAYLSNIFHKSQLPDEQRLAMIAKLNKQVPAIVRGCRDSPTRKYMSLLPVEIRELL